MARSNERLRTLATMTRRFGQDERGNFAVILALMLVPLMLFVGASVDGARFYMAQNHLQDATDSLSLALASSVEQDDTKLRTMADSYLLTNITPATLQGAAISDFKTSADEIEVSVGGHIDATFMKMAGFDRLDLAASALAKRSPVRVVEVALVLDTTYSMIETDRGVKKIDTLKEAASELVSQLLPEDPEDTDNDVRISMVPYSDYVNVGIENRGASWLTTPAEKSERVCTTYTEQNDCSQRDPPKTCTRNRDGIIESYECGGQCKKVPLIPPKTSCTTNTVKWHGCVASRVGRSYITNDSYPSVRYPSMVHAGQRCPSPMIPLTADRAKLLAGIDGLTTHTNGYFPLTYIPAGMVWGVNALSPTAPLVEGADYDPMNVEPYKIIILMTDGDNTLRYRDSDGEHVSPGGSSSQQSSQLRQTNTDTTALCNYAKSKKIEVYTVAFMVDNDAALQMLKGCATTTAKYFDAKNRERLLSAFSGIARSISQVRLAR